MFDFIFGIYQLLVFIFYWHSYDMHTLIAHMRNKSMHDIYALFACQYSERKLGWFIVHLTLFWKGDTIIGSCKINNINNQKLCF